LSSARPQKAKPKSLIVSKQLKNLRAADFSVLSPEAVALKGAAKMAHEPEPKPAIPAAANKPRHPENPKLEKPI